MKRVGLVGLVGLVAVVVGACADTLPPTGQLVVHLDTNAPLADAPLFDRVTVELFPPSSRTPCSECTRELAVDVAKVRAGTFSFGFVPPPRVVGFVARLRLFRSAGRSIPRPASTIELVGYLPAVAEDGVVHLTATFRADDVGRPRGTFEAPITFEKRLPSPSAEGTWTPGLATNCTREAPSGASCVQGGAFFMGDPRVSATFGDVGGVAEHLVVLAPYFLDRREVTVADLRASKLARFDSRGRLVDPADATRLPENGGCTYTPAAGAFEDLPVNCVSWTLARAYCQARGGDLPTEAEFEMAASARGSRLFPWGDRDPSCAEAAVANAPASEGGAPCRPPPLGVGELGPEQPGRGSLDRVLDLADLAANVGEWARDVYAADDSVCWKAPLLVDPVCDTGDPDVRSVKGGDFVTTPLPYVQTRAGRSGATLASGGSGRAVGFRCATPGR
jgi:sulfatase modifying factor 1